MNKKIVSYLLIIILIPVVYSSGWHIADEIFSGNFTGNYDFNNTPTVDGKEVQIRVDGTCEEGSSIRIINADGSVVCETIDSLASESDPIYSADPASGITNTNISNWDTAYSWGDHSSVGYLTTESDTLDSVTNRDSTTANGISVGSLDIGDTTSCGKLYTDSSGNVLCGSDANSGGDITEVVAGDYLTGGGTSGSVTLNVNDNWVDVSGDTMSGNLHIEPTGSGIIFSTDTTSSDWGIPWYGLFRANNTNLDLDESSSGNPLALSNYYGIGLKTHTGSLVLTREGNVGIGTTSPNSKLDVIGEARFDDQIMIEQGSQNLVIANNEASNLIHIDVTGTSHATDKIHLGDLSSGDNDITTLGNVGVGTTSPGAPLEVFSNRDLATNNQHYDYATLMSRSGSAGIGLGQSNGIPAIFGYGTGTSYNLALNPNNGNVGIGTTSPDEKLTIGGSISTVRGTGQNTTITLFGANYTKGNRIIVGSDDTSAYIKSTFGAEGSAALRFLRATGTESMRIDHGGNVGIGTNSPSYKLDVAGGDTRFSGDMQINGGADALRFSNWATLGNTDGNGRFSIYENAYDAGSKYINSEAASRVTLSSDAIKFYTASSGTADDTISWNERLRIANNGYVGIGTTAPQEELHVDGGTIRGKSIYADNYLKIGNETSYTYISDGIAGPQMGVAENFVVYSSDFGDKYMYFDVLNTDLELGSSYVDVEVKDDLIVEGNLGIGTTGLPSHTLDVNGDFNANAIDVGRSDVYLESNSYDNVDGAGITLRVSNNPSNTGGAMFAVRSSGQANRLWVGQSFTSTGSNEFYVGSSDHATANDPSLYAAKIGGNANSDSYFNSGGNVGIGTTTPSYELDIEASDNSGTLAISETGGVTTKLQSYNNVYGIVGTQSNHDLQLRTNNARVMQLTTGGNVGIGTSAPEGNLHIYSSATSSTEPIPLLKLEVADDGATTNIGHGPAINFYVPDETATGGTGYSQFGAQIAAIKTNENEINGDTALTFSTSENAGDLNEWLRITPTGDVCGPDFDLSNCASDERLKKNITDMPYTLEQVASLRPVNFNWNEKANEIYGYSTDKPNVGFIAQEVEEVIPNWVITNDKGYKKVDDGMLKYGLLNSVKELNEIRKEQEKDIKELKEENEQLKTIICKQFPNESICNSK